MRHPKPKTSAPRLLNCFLLLAAMLVAAACSDSGISGTGDVGDAPPITDDDDEIVPVSISGQVIAVDRETGIELSDDEYHERAGLLLVYLLEDPDDLTQVIDKRTLAEPGSWAIEDFNYEGQIYVVAIASDSSPIIGANSLQRRYPFNPLRVAGRPLCRPRTGWPPKSLRDAVPTDGRHSAKGYVATNAQVRGSTCAADHMPRAYRAGTRSPVGRAGARRPCSRAELQVRCVEVVRLAAVAVARKRSSSRPAPGP